MEVLNQKIRRSASESPKIRSSFEAYVEKVEAYGRKHPTDELLALIKELKILLVLYDAGKMRTRSTIEKKNALVHSITVYFANLVLKRLRYVSAKAKKLV